MLTDLSPPTILPSVESTNSDHDIITVSWNHSINTPLPRAKKRKHKIFHYDKMNNETWVNFAESISQSLHKDNIEVDSPIIDTGSLNKLWHKLNLAIKIAANTHIPYSFKSPQPYFAFSRKATDLHQSLKKINKIYNQALHLQPPLSPII